MLEILFDEVNKKYIEYKLSLKIIHEMLILAGYILNGKHYKYMFRSNLNYSSYNKDEILLYEYKAEDIVRLIHNTDKITSINLAYAKYYMFIMKKILYDKYVDNCRIVVTVKDISIMRSKEYWRNKFSRDNMKLGIRLDMQMNKNMVERNYDNLGIYKKSLLDREKKKELSKIMKNILNRENWIKKREDRQTLVIKQNGNISDDYESLYEYDEGNILDLEGNDKKIEFEDLFV